MGAALCDVVAALRQCYPGVENVLFASFRQQVKHFHLHLLPLWPEEEKAWRKAAGYRESHWMEFIGSLEKKQSKEAQCLESTEKLASEIEALRRATKYRPTT